ncbi:MAG: methyltransferase domain-containing protein [Anaerolineales bacterium]|jgi:ubiquinone/menaquinone biosynthesis C-methylase UbiE
MTKQTSKSLSQIRFNKFAKSYVTSETHAKGIELQRLVEIAQPKNNWKMLDVATGGGHTALTFSTFVAEVIATDLTPNMLAAAESFIRRNGVDNVSFKPADAEDLPFDDKSFDLVTCRIAAHHFPNCMKFVRESTRVLKTNKILLVQDQLVPEDEDAARSINNFERIRDPSHNKAFSESEWVDMFLSAGLQVEQIEHIVKKHDFFPWVEIQDCSARTIHQLETLIAEADSSVLEWIEPNDFGTPKASFINHHIIILGRK